VCVFVCVCVYRHWLLWCPIAVKPKLYIAHHLWGWGEKRRKEKRKKKKAKIELNWWSLKVWGRNLMDNGNTHWAKSLWICSPFLLLECYVACLIDWFLTKFFDGIPKMHVGKTNKFVSTTHAKALSKICILLVKRLMSLDHNNLDARIWWQIWCFFFLNMQKNHKVGWSYSTTNIA